MIHRLYFANLQEEFLQPLKELEKFLGFEISGKETATFFITTYLTEKGSKIVINENKVEISYHTKVEFFRTLGLLFEYQTDMEENNEKKVLVKEEHPAFTNLTYMQDNSRNAVSSPAAICKMIRHLALMGYHSFMLYTEDTYEVEGYPFFGYMRGRFTKEELKDIDAYAKLFGIEMVPCIQTLAHLTAPLRWKAFGEIKDIKDILLCGEPKTYEFIEAMIKTYSEVFTSRRINIGMDEAELLGLGNYLRLNGFKDRFHIMLDHLNKVLSICDKYGLQAMMWSDMFFKLLSDSSNDYYGDVDIPEKINKMIPKNVKLIYWDYYSREKSIYDRMFERHLQLSDNIGFAGGAWRWTGFSPLLEHSVITSELALKSCIEHGIKEVIVTGWGDNGSESSAFSVGPILQLYAEVCYTRNFSKSHLTRRLYSCMHMVYQDFMEMDALNMTPDNPSPGRLSVAPSKYIFYQDLLMGLFDKHIDEITYPGHFKTCFEAFTKIAEKENEYSYIFDTLAKLSHVLYLKCDLGIRLKNAYDKKDKAALMQFTTEECPKLLEYIEDFHAALRYQWFLESKPFGFDVQDIRIGGLKERICAARRRIEEYLSDRTDRLEEFEQERLLLDRTENPGYKTLPVYNNEWRTMVTASIL